MLLAVSCLSVAFSKCIGTCQSWPDHALQQLVVALLHLSRKLHEMTYDTYKFYPPYASGSGPRKNEVNSSGLILGIPSMLSLTIFNYLALNFPPAC
ncbi:hypothetical protein QL093DRAFT_1074435 [Fusarium oxysporum]|nr:hypothetical protein QL093DRAFT_1074435 [Fusarium oxysporum]